MFSFDGRIFAGFLCAAVLAGCGGGGGGGTSGGVTPVNGSTPGGGTTATPTAKPTSTPTGTPVTLPSANAASPSLVTVNSNPVGLNITIDGAAAGVTPATPVVGYGAHSVVVSPKSGALPFTIAITNSGNGPIAIFYNQTSDSSGNIASGLATSSVPGGRRPQSITAFGIRRSAGGFAGRPAYAQDKISVQYDVAAFGGTRSFDAVESTHGIARAQTFTQTSSRVTRVLALTANQTPEAAVAAMQGERGVVTASRIGLRYPASSTAGTFYPNDTYFKATNNGVNADQWYLWLIDSQDAWGYGSSKAPIAIVDTGYDPQQTEIAGLVTTSQTIVNLLSYANTATDTDGHGTFLSGVADAQMNNGAGFAGAAYNAPLQEYKIFPNGSASAQTSDEAAAIRAAVANGAKVILLALQSTPANGPDPLERDAVAYALANGVTVVAASGDDNGTALDYPAGYPGVVSVGASIVNDAGTPGSVAGQGNNEAVAAYSNAGSGLGLVAPGGQGTGGDTNVLHWIENAYTTQPAAGLPACPAGTSPSDCKILFTGTSPAAALVAGTAALMLTVNASLTPAQVAQMLYASADDIKDQREGHGRLNAQRAVALAAGDTSAQPGLPLPRAIQFVAIAYTNSGAALPAVPAIADSAYPKGVPVNADGTFRLADVNPTSLPLGVTAYKIGVWLSLFGDGKVHPGDYFATATCSISASCSASIANLTVTKIAAATTTLP